MTREGWNDPRARGRTHSGISPLALPISGVLHWRGRSPQPSRKRYRINVSLITYTAPARAFHPLLLLSVPLLSFPFCIHDLLATYLVTLWHYDPLKKQTFIRILKKVVIARRRCSSLERASTYYFRYQLKRIIPWMVRQEDAQSQRHFSRTPPWNSVSPVRQNERFTVP